MQAFVAVEFAVEDSLERFVAEGWSCLHEFSFDNSLLDRAAEVVVVAGGYHIAMLVDYSAGLFNDIHLLFVRADVEQFSDRHVADVVVAGVE